jgi:(p)ppGpp synthase/HD superfamily hydrolase
MIYLICDRTTKEQIDEMLQTLDTYIKLAVDIERGVLARGGVYHADCESILLEDGSEQQNIWGADWNPSTQEVTYEALINIRPRQNNRSMVIADLKIREQVAQIAHKILGNV